MAVDSVHPDYKEKLARWTKNRDAYGGEDAVKSRGVTYLPRPGGFVDSEFQSFKERASWYGATKRTIQGLTGAVFQKAPVVEALPRVEGHLKNVTLTGWTADMMGQKVLSEVELQGRYGVLLDYSEELRRPYWSGFACESIIKWHQIYMGGQGILTMLTLKESLEDLDGDDIERTDRYRLCHINQDGVYEVVIFQEHIELSNRNRSIDEIARYVPTRRGVPLDFIPFVFFNTDDLTPNVCDGPLDDLVDKNFSYYRHSANYEHGLFLTGCPTPVITGHSLTEGERIPIGSLAAWVFPNPEAKAYLLEYQGQGLQSHERAMAQDKQEMASLGSRLLEETPETQETLGAVQIRHSGETGSLKSLTNIVSQGLTKLLRWHHWWDAATEQLEDENFSFILNTDFSTTRLSPQELQALMQLWQGGGISKQTLFWNLQQGEIVPDDTTYEDEQSLIEMEQPARIPFGDVQETEDEPQAA